MKHGIKRTVHILRHGHALCNKEKLRTIPAEWPKGHVWVSLEGIENATCESCIAEGRRINRLKRAEVLS